MNECVQKVDQSVPHITERLAEVFPVNRVKPVVYSFSDLPAHAVPVNLCNGVSYQRSEAVKPCCKGVGKFDPVDVVKPALNCCSYSFAHLGPIDGMNEAVNKINQGVPLCGKSFA